MGTASPRTTMTQKVWIHVDSGDGEPQRICWYMGTSDVMVENAIRMQLHMARTSRFLLRDSDGDLVPVSTTLPHDQTYQLVQVHDTTSRSFDSYSGDHSGHDVHHQPRQKRRYREMNGSNAIGVSTEELQRVIPNCLDGYSSQHSVIPTDQYVFSLSSDTSHSTSLSTPPASTPPPRSVVHIVTRFLETFTRAIPNDDNINFIPSTGSYALYELYRHIFPDTVYHPKTQNAFYKMTSLQGKVDRQRVIRYYQHRSSRVGAMAATEATQTGANTSGADLEFVLYKPEGKGPLLRKYVQVGTDIAAAELVRAADFVAVLGLHPHQIVAKYMEFLDGFQPIAKASYQAHTKPNESGPSPM